MLRLQLRRLTTSFAALSTPSSATGSEWSGVVDNVPTASIVTPPPPAVTTMGEIKAKISEETRFRGIN